ncbi:hypothetical protein KUM39_18810 [Streptomyces sp. J2-1]|uniref:hypothetical protein n=1 Tax=Streptomyces corallincola TaxID=2851888 RepID=UPI001C37F229|nr:hypothetical protein [Streptomyces corallincola]MBV2356405.1 hypothetical protein [Streptomyces corallincola]
MLRILDARTGRTVPAAPTRHGLTRIEAHVNGPGPTALRVLLTADLLARALDLEGTPVRPVLVAASDTAELRADADALGIRPFEVGAGAAPGLRETQVVRVVGAGGAIGADPDGGPAEGTGVPDGEGPLLVVAPAQLVVPGADGDPAVLRLALLSVPRAVTAVLGPDQLDAAATTLARLRHAVARWARQPSRPVPEAAKERLRTVWENDLDLPGVLAVLRDIEAGLVPQGPAPRARVQDVQVGPELGDPERGRPSQEGSQEAGARGGSDGQGAQEGREGQGAQDPSVRPERPSGTVRPESHHRMVGPASREGAVRPEPGGGEAGGGEPGDVDTRDGETRDARPGRGTGDGLPEGARFETFLYADRLLALELARDLGSLA